MIELVTDRTQADVDRANYLASKSFMGMSDEEIAEWMMGMKGAYNHTDFNRVETVVAELAEKLGLSVITKTDWYVWDIPTQADADRFLDNIKLIRKKGTCYTTTPTAPKSMGGLTYTGANDIEKILFDVRKTEPSLFRCGELFCDEV